MDTEVVVRGIEYKMPIEMAKNYVKTSKSQKIKDINSKSAQDFLVKVVNEEFGIKGTCIRVIPY